MKILIISKCPSHPTFAGNSRFILDQVELFKEMGHDVYFLFVQELALSPKKKNFIHELETLKSYWKDHLFIYTVSLLNRLRFRVIDRYRKLFYNGLLKCDDHYPSNLHKFINKLHEKIHFDCCLVNYYYLSKAFNHINIKHKGLVTHDYFAYKNILVNDNNIPTATTAHEEAIAMQRSQNIFALNTEEAIYFQKLSPLSNIYTIYSIYKYVPHPIVNNKNILFLSGSNQFNINGLNWFITNIFPLITEVFPEAKLIIGGAICTKIKEYGNHPNIVLQGFIDDINAFYKQGDVAINPTYQGTGLKIKTFEAIAYDKITLVHPHSKIGIYDINNAPLFASIIAQDWVDFLKSIWEESDKIEKIKERNKQYISNMNTHVKKEYKRFFNNQH